VGPIILSVFSNYIVKVPLRKFNNIFPYADNLGYLKGQETFCDNEAEFI